MYQCLSYATDLVYVEKIMCLCKYVHMHFIYINIYLYICIKVYLEYVTCVL